MLGEPGDARPALAQRRRGEPDDVESVEQILAEAVLGRLGVQRPVRGGDDPQVEPLGAVLAEAADLAVLEHAQQLDLGARRQFDHLVAEDRAVDRHEGGSAAKALLVDRPRDQLLAHPRLALNDHRERRGGDPRDLLLQLPH